MDLIELFTEPLYQTFREAGNMQEILIEITAENKEQTVASIKQYANNGEKMKEYIHSLYICLPCRHEKLSLFAELASLTIPQEMKEYFIHCGFHRDHSLAFITTRLLNYQFLRICAGIPNFITFNDIFTELDKLTSTSTLDDDNLKQFYYWFAPELDQTKSTSLPHIHSLFKQDEMEAISKDDYSSLRSKFNLDSFYSEIERVIRLDDLNSFIPLIEVQPHHFALDQRIPPNILFHYYRPTLIEYAAFCGSMKILQFLEIQGASYTTGYSSEGFSLSHFAIAGGSLEAVLFSKRCGASFMGSLQISVLFHRMAIFSWILQTMPIDINETLPTFQSPLYRAAESDSISFLLLLIENGALPYTDEKTDSNALLVSVQNENLILAHILLLSGADPDFHQETVSISETPQEPQSDKSKTTLLEMIQGDTVQLDVSAKAYMMQMSDGEIKQSFQDLFAEVEKMDPSPKSKMKKRPIPKKDPKLIKEPEKTVVLLDPLSNSKVNSKSNNNNNENHGPFSTRAARGRGRGGISRFRRRISPE